MHERTEEMRARVLREDRAQREGQAAYAGTLKGWALEATPADQSVLSKWAVRFTYADKPDFVSVLKKGG